MRTILRCRRPLRAATAIAAALALSALPGAAAAAGTAARAPAGPAGHPSRPPSHVSGVIHAVPQAGPARPIQPGGSVRATPGREFSLRKLAGKRPARRAGRPVAMAPHAARGTAPMITANYSGLDGGGPSDFIRNYGVSAASNGSVTMEIAGNAVTVYSSDGAQTCARISLGRLAGTSDPDGGKVIYDSRNGRFILAATEYLSTAMYVATSDTSDPCGTWHWNQLTFQDLPFGPYSHCLYLPSLGQTGTAVLVGMSQVDGTCYFDSDWSLAFAVPKDQLYGHTTVSSPWFAVSSRQPGVSAVDSGGTGMPGYFVLDEPEIGYSLYRLDGADTGNPSFALQTQYIVQDDAVTDPPQPGTSSDLHLGLGEPISPVSLAWDGSRIWFASAFNPGGPAARVRYGVIDPAAHTFQDATASHSRSSADFNPSIGVSAASGVDTVFLNWATVDAAQGMPVSDTVATLLYNGGSLPDLQGADQVLFTGQSTSADEEFAQWSAVSALPDQAYPACGVTAQQYWDSGDDWHTRLARVCGPSTVTMPDVTGGTAGAAGSTLQAAFLGTGPQTLTTACPPSQNHLVISTVPAPGAATAIGWQTPLTVCNLDVSVPGVLTFGDGAARNAIAAAGLTVGAVTMAPSCTQARGSVLTQDPGEGTQVIRGSAVSLTESTGKQPNGKTCPIA